MQEKLYRMPESQTIACLGSSTTAGYFDEEGLGYVSRLSQAIAKDHPLKYHVYNAGVSGDTTLDGWFNLISHVARLEPAILVIMIGVNDVCIREGHSVEEHQIPHFKRLKVWNDILTYVHKMGWKHLVVGPVPVETDITRFSRHENSPQGMTGYRYQNSDIKDYNDMLEKISQEKHSPFLRLYETWYEKRALGLYADGLHPNSKGHGLFADYIYAELKKLKYVG